MHGNHTQVGIEALQVMRALALIFSRGYDDAVRGVRRLPSGRDLARQHISGTHRRGVESKLRTIYSLGRWYAELDGNAQAQQDDAIGKPVRLAAGLYRFAAGQDARAEGVEAYTIERHGRGRAAWRVRTPEGDEWADGFRTLRAAVAAVEAHVEQQMHARVDRLISGAIDELGRGS